MTIFSHSRLSCFENCPRRYFFSYLEKLKVEKEGIEAFMGLRVHETLEKLYNELKFTKLNSLEDLLAYYEKLWEENWNESVVVVKKGLKPKHYFDLGKKCIVGYYNRHKPFDKDKTIACEKMIRFSLDEDGKYKMKGFIDRLAEEKPGNYVIHDYKASTSLPLQNHFDEDRQLALYSIAIKNDFPDCKDVDLCWHYVVFDKDFYSKRSEQQLESLKKHMIELIQEVERAEKENNFPAKDSRLCDWCAFTQLCPAKKHQVITESLTVKEFKKNAGVKLVNKYVELSGKMTELEFELNKLKQDVFGYASQFELEKIVGSEAALKIMVSKGFSFAGMEKEEKEQLMSILKSEKLLNNFLSLDTRALGTAVTKQDLEKELTKKVKKFGEETESKSLRLVKK